MCLQLHHIDRLPYNKFAGGRCLIGTVVAFSLCRPGVGLTADARNLLFCTQQIPFASISLEDFSHPGLVSTVLIALAFGAHKAATRELLNSSFEGPHALASNVFCHSFFPAVVIRSIVMLLKLLCLHTSSPV